MNQQELNRLFNNGKLCFEQQEYRKAQMIFNEIIENDENKTEAFFYLANIFHIKGELGKAIKAFQKVLTLDPNYTDAAISLSVLLNDIGRYEEARSIFDSANEKVKKTTQGIEDSHINKKFAIKHEELAELYLSYNRYDEAVFEFNKAIGLNPENLELRIKLAKVYSKKGFVSKATEELKKLKNEYPGYIPCRIALGLLQYGNGNILEAHTEWQNVLSIEPKNEEAKMYLNLSKDAQETNLTI
ncbi:MAG: tetratricopeptide repeat protein [Bacteriovoracaceae bacterium]|nr:tetratricopeptide repeat protein [Bacteriovoracaceae bacterium]